MASSLRELVVSVTVNSTNYQREMARVSRMGASYAQTFRQGSEQMTRGWNQQTAAARTHATAMQGASQALGRYAAVAASAFGVGQLTQLADGWTQVNNRLRLVTNSSESFGQAQADVLRIARATYQDLDATAGVYQNLAMAQDRLGITSAQTARLVETVNKTIAMSGSSSAAATGALVQLGQAFASGTLRAEEFNSLMEGAPRLVMALEDGLGVARGSLRQMVIDGEVSAQAMATALLRMSDSVDGAFGQMVVTVRQATTNLRTSFQEVIGKADEASGASAAVARGINLLAENMEAVATIGGGVALGAFTGKLVELSRAAAAAGMQSVRSAVAARAEALAYRDATAAALSMAQADVRKAQAAQVAARGTAESARQSRNLASALLAQRQAAFAAAEAQAALTSATRLSATAGRAALAAFGGPAGLAITLGLAAAGWVMFKDNTDESRESLIDLNATLDETIAKFRELDRARQAGELLTLSDQIDEAARRIREAVALLGNEADFTDLAGGFGQGLQQLQRDFEAGRLSAEQFANRVSDMARQLADTGQIEEVQRRGIIRYAESISEAAREVERKKGLMAALTGENNQLTAAANNSTAAVRGQASALRDAGSAADEARKRIQQALATMPGQIARIGKSPVEIARMDGNEMVEAAIASGRGAYTRAGRPNEALRQIMDEARQNVEWTQKLVAAQEAYERSTKAASAAEDEAKRRMDETKRAADQLAERYADLEASQRREIELYGQTGRAAQLAYDLAHGALQQFSETQKAVLREQAAWLDQLDEIAAHEEAVAQIRADHAKAVTEQVDRMTVYAEQAGRNIQSALGDTLYSILDGRFDDIGDSFANMLRRMAAELAASQMLSMLGGAMAGYGGTGTWGNLIRGIGGAMQTSGGRASGGRVEAFKAYDIAEHGQPEILSYGGRSVLIMGAQGGMVSPLMNAKGGGTGAVGAQQPQINVQIVKGANEDRVESSQAPGGGLNLKIMVRDTVRGLAASGELDGVMRQRFGMAPRGVPTG